MKLIVPEVHRVTRSQFRLHADILALSLDPVNTTCIIYGIGLSNSQFKHHIQFMVRLGLIERKGRFWITTAKGRKYIDAFERLMEVFEGPSGPTGNNGRLTRKTRPSLSNIS